MIRRPSSIVGLAAIALAFACSSEQTAPRGSTTDEVELPSLASTIGFHDANGKLTARAPSYGAEIARKDGALVVKAGRDRLVVRPATFARGVSASSVGARGDAHLENDSVIIDRGRAVERLVATRAGVEQSFTFDTKPMGTGALVVREEILARAPLVAGRHDVRSGRFVIRDARWIDANGVTTPLSMSAEGDALVLRVPEDVVEKSAYPAVLDPTIGPELNLEAPVVAGFPESTYSTRIAGGKNGRALAIWADERFAIPFYNGMFDGEQITGARIDANGTILDPTGIVIIPQRDAYLDEQALVFDGNDKWFVTWTDSTSNAPCGLLWGALVNDAGTVLSAKEMPGGCSGGDVSAGFDGTTFLTLLSSRFNGAFYLTRMSTAGEPLDQLPKQIGTTGNSQRGTAALACKTGSCLAAWSTVAGPRAARIGANLTVVDATPLVLGASNVAVNGATFDGDNWAVLVGTSIVRVDPLTGAVTAPTALSAEARAIASDGTNTWVTWTASGQVLADRVTRQGALVAGGPISLTTSANVSSYVSPSIAFAGTTGWLGWDDQRTYTSGEAYAMRFNLQGASLDPNGFLLAKAANGQWKPAVAASATGFLVGWVDASAPTGGAQDGAFVARLDANGANVDTIAKSIDPGGSDIAIASNGTDYLVVSASATGASAVRVDAATGATLPPVIPLATGPAVSFVAATWDGSQYVALWLDGATLRAARISTAGAMVGSAFQVSASAAVGYYPRIGIASDGTTSLAVWTGDHISAARIDKSGNVLDTTPIVVEQSFGNTLSPSVTWDGTQYVVAWEDYRSGHIIDSEVYAARISSAGVLLQSPKEILVAGGTGVSQFPSIVSMNDDYSDLVVWTDSRNPISYKDFSLLATFVRRSDGKVLDEAPLVVSNRRGDEMFSALAPAGKGRVLAVYQSMDYSPGVGNARIKARMIGSGNLLGAACTQDSDCVTRACADGVCCDRACKGTCETCGGGGGGTAGTCRPVVDAEDVDTCADDRSCSTTSECKKKTGRSCAVDADCGTGFCTDNICCERACDGACETCAALTGKCELRSARSPGTPACAPYACTGDSPTCPTSCTSDLACPVGSRCKDGVCSAGASCVTITVAALVDESRVDCRPYVCGGGNCRTSCRSVEDCASGFVCDENGKCVTPPEQIRASGGGCAISRETPSRSSPFVVTAVILLLAFGIRTRRSTAERRTRAWSRSA